MSASKRSARQGLSPLVCTLLLVSLISCQDNAPASSPSAESPSQTARARPTVLKSAAGVLVLVSGHTNGSADALISGMLAIKHGCAGVRAGDFFNAVVWPNGTTVAAGDTLALTLPDGSVLSEGANFTGGGGSYTADRIPDFAPAIPQACQAGPETVVLGSASLA